MEQQSWVVTYGAPVVGWLGTALFIVAYWQLNRGKWKVEDNIYHVFNILGSIFLVINTAVDQSYAALMANLFWGVIALYGLLMHRKVVN